MGYANKRGNKKSQKDARSGWFTVCKTCSDQSGKTPWIAYSRIYVGMPEHCFKCKRTWDVIAAKQGYPVPKGKKNPNDPKNAEGDKPTQLGAKSFLDALIG